MMTKPLFKNDFMNVHVAICRWLSGERLPVDTMPNVENILISVCEHYEIMTADLLGKDRKRKYRYPRQVFSFLAKNIAKLTLIQIARLLNQDHTTVIHSIRVIDDFITVKHMDTKEEIEIIIEKIKTKNNEQSNN